MLNINPNKKAFFLENAAKFLKKNGISLLMGTALVAMLVNPDAKAWVLQKLLFTGLFNAKIEQKAVKNASQTAADFSFTNENNEVINTTSLRGKVVFINFWASWCGPCRAEFPSIEKLYTQFKDNPNVYFLMINADDDISKAQNYIEKEQFTIPLQHAYGAIPDAVYTGTLPTTVVLDKKGNIRFSHEGFANYASEDFIKQIHDLIKE